MSFKADKQVQQQFFTYASLVLIFLLICRLIANYFIPLFDTTEARYGEIARKMLETGNWVTLQQDYGIPFWAKPPLSTWLSAFFMHLLGVNEFAARLPGLLLSIGILWLVWGLAKKHSGSMVALFSLLVLAGTLYFFIDAGTVMTDPALIFCTTLASVSFWHAMVYDNKLWSYIFFIGLGLGLLAKGPIAVMFVGMTVFFWVLLRNEWANLWRRLPWIKGTILVLAIAAPWYILAEIRTPGFLNYFILGEHLQRFLTPGWTGDKYGIAHHAPKGMIWLYAIAGVFPWNIVAGRWFLKHGKRLPALCQDEDGWLSYLLLWAIVPLFFFTFASNIIYPYVFPALPAFALLFSEIWHRSNEKLDNLNWVLISSLLCGVLFLAGAFILKVKPEIVPNTQKPIISTWFKQHPASGSNLIYWDYKTDFSAEFYSKGKVKSVKNIEGLCQLLSNHLENYLVIDSNETGQIPKNLFEKFTPVKTFRVHSKTMLLLHSPVLAC
ncbi:dolichyl-phosphate-mannose-protein mannosyltransferase [Legionella norrlandica]|uniref:Dolichyl-phosphate-mannose-protein mannosyltransferase n=1 Tax=Legionella norrlandica TaxID=1498499 RepID=A0A0A2T4J9_9GAMM|nr:glycosyltransferase family 39 protein [Legionella norrlandica]KGP62348.1 dolichyl-phosphate-mannose-protein mannosyltransferase [Legionella norrlandica]